MKAILEFNLDDGDDRQAHLRAIKALDMSIALWDMDQYLRGLIKYGELDDITYKALQDTRDKLREIMDDRGINLDELMS